MTSEAVEQAAQVLADAIWRIHGPESTDRESAEMDGNELAQALAAANLLATTQGAGDEAWDYGIASGGGYVRRRPAGPWEPVDQHAVTE